MAGDRGQILPSLSRQNLGLGFDVTAGADDHGGTERKRDRAGAGVPRQDRRRQGEAIAHAMEDRQFDTGVAGWCQPCSETLSFSYPEK